MYTAVPLRIHLATSALLTFSRTATWFRSRPPSTRDDAPARDDSHPGTEERRLRRGNGQGEAATWFSDIEMLLRDRRCGKAEIIRCNPRVEESRECWDGFSFTRYTPTRLPRYTHSNTSSVGEAVMGSLFRLQTTVCI